MTKAQKNQYEELIDKMMIDEVSGLDHEISETLKSLSTDKKRMAILSILDGDRDLFLKVKNMMKDDSLGKYHYSKEIVKMLREYVKVGEVEKKAFGEVMTPISLVQDMLDTLPKEVWSNPNLKFLDPCAGCGIFPSVIINRLMYGLKEFEPNEELRYKHIVENQLYVGELQAKNMFLFLCAFDPNDEYSLNVYNGSFLDEGFDNHTREIWGIEKFDVIVMNPPYQELKEGNKKSQPLWDKFVKKSIENCLVEEGYFVAVHPSGWRNVDGMFKETQKLLKSKQVLLLEIHNEKDGLKTFGAETRYDFYCVKNSPSNNFLTTIKCQDGTIENVNISQMEFIPNGMFVDVFKLIAKDGEIKVDSIGDSSYHTQRIERIKDEKTLEFKYPCVYHVKNGDKVTLKYSNINNKGHFGIPKLIWSNFRIISAGSIVDVNGEFGMTQFAYAIIDEPDNLSLIKKAFDSKKFRDLMEVCAGGDSIINRKAISTFRKDFWKEFLD